jgi:hypothetical protein
MKMKMNIDPNMIRARWSASQSNNIVPPLR